MGVFRQIFEQKLTVIRSGKVWTKLNNRLFGWKRIRTGQNTKTDLSGEYCTERELPSVVGMPQKHHTIFW